MADKVAGRLTAQTSRRQTPIYDTVHYDKPGMQIIRSINRDRESILHYYSLVCVTPIRRSPLTNVTGEMVMENIAGYGVEFKSGEEQEKIPIFIAEHGELDDVARAMITKSLRQLADDVEYGITGEVKV